MCRHRFYAKNRSKRNFRYVLFSAYICFIKLGHACRSISVITKCTMKFRFVICYMLIHSCDSICTICTSDIYWCLYFLYKAKHMACMGPHANRTSSIHRYARKRRLKILNYIVVKAAALFKSKYQSFEDRLHYNLVSLYYMQSKMAHQHD